jgi:hypothetical protein
MAAHTRRHRPGRPGASQPEEKEAIDEHAKAACAPYLAERLGPYDPPSRLAFALSVDSRASTSRIRSLAWAAHIMIDSSEGFRMWETSTVGFVQACRSAGFAAESLS